MGECGTDIAFRIQSDGEYIRLDLLRTSPYAEGSLCYLLSTIQAMGALRDVKMAEHVGQQDQRK